MNQILLRHEIYRKVLHFMLLLLPVIYCNLGKWFSLIIFFCFTIFIVSIDRQRQNNPAINNFFTKIFSLILRPHELKGDKLCGASWVGIAACVNFLLFKKEIAVTAFAIMVISDGIAAIIGRNFPGRPFFEKSASGSLAFAISGFVTLISCGVIFDVKTWFYVFGLFALFCVTMFESRPSLLKIDDNFTIPIGFSVIMTFFDIIWNYNY
jgi:dolichol kinase